MSISQNSFNSWVNRYRTNGEDGLITRERNKSYTSDFKIKVIKEYENGEGSLNDLAIKHNISSHSVLLNSINKYNSHKDIKDYDPSKGKDIYMAKNRKFSIEEKIKVAKWCIDNNLDYKQAAFDFDVSYANAHSWTKKFIEFGEEGLTDNRLLES